MLYVIYNREWNIVEPRAFRTYAGAEAYIKSRGWTQCAIETIVHIE